MASMSNPLASAGISMARPSVGRPERFPKVFRARYSRSAMREDADSSTLKGLIHALPDSLNLVTVYGDFPLHAACHRRVHADVVREVALACSLNQLCLILESSMSGQTPIGVAIEDSGLWWSVDEEGSHVA